MLQGRHVGSCKTERQSFMAVNVRNFEFSMSVRCNSFMQS